MARMINRLSDLVVKRLNTPGLYHDGAGLYLQVSPSGAKSWVFRFGLDNKTRNMGLGPLRLYSLAEARQRAKDAAKLRHEGIDPIDRRNAQRTAQRLVEAKTKTFAECFEAWMKAHSQGWSEKYESVQRSQMAMHILPSLGSLSVAAIDTGLVLRVLEPVWSTKTVTAKRMRENIEAVLDYAKAHGYRTGENPARWKGHLKNLLAKPAKLHKVQHRPALPYSEMGTFMAALRACPPDRDTLALEFTILTAARVGEIAGATWGEVDMAEKTWTVPGSRMKGGLEHRVPLPVAAIDILGRIEHRTGLLFPKATDKSLERLRHDIGYGHITTHGFRSTFRDWAGERTNFQREVIEKALAHKVGDETERAYQRGDLLAKRRELMDSWARYCATPPATCEVVPLRRHGP